MIHGNFPFQFGIREQAIWSDQAKSVSTSVKTVAFLLQCFILIGKCN